MSLSSIKRRLILTSCKAAQHSALFYSASQQEKKKYLFRDQIKASKNIRKVIFRAEMEKPDNFEEVDEKKTCFDTMYSEVI